MWAVAAAHESTLVAIRVTDSLRSADETLPLRRSANKSNNNTVVFFVDVADSIKRSKDKTLHL